MTECHTPTPERHGAIIANEVTSSARIAYDDGISDGFAEVVARVENSAGKRFTKLKQTIGTSEEALQLGEISAVGAVFIKNLDETNYVEIKTTTGGTIVARLEPDLNGDGNGGWVGLSRAGSGFQAPWAIANTAACKVVILIVEQ